MPGELTKQCTVKEQRNVRWSNKAMSGKETNQCKAKVQSVRWRNKAMSGEGTRQCQV